MRVNRWELNRGYRGKSSGRNDLRLIECVLRVFGNLGRRSDPESSILTIFARPRDFSKLPKTHARKGPRFQWLSELLRVPRQRAARLASVHRVFLPSFSNGMTTRDHSSGRPRWIRFREKLSRCRQTLEQIQPGCTLPRRKKQKAVSSVREIYNSGERSRVMSAEFLVIAELATVIAPSATV